ncbi:hypothetical protein [Roseibium sp.]|uniref:hypothetical protein n=1 Tax=Roseibium sp. TaxID=1936156 RepID=UPI003B51FE71
MDTTQIRAKLQSEIEAFDPSTATAEKTELAGAQVLLYDALLKSATENTSVSSSKSTSPALVSNGGQLFTPNYPKFAVQELGYIHTTGNYHPPKIVDGVLVFGGAQGTSAGGTTSFTFIAGPVAGKKQLLRSSIANVLVKMQNAATCYDTEKRIVYHPTQDGYFGHASIVDGSTGVANRAEITGQTVAAAYHQGFKKSFVATGNTAVWVGDDILEAHTAMTMPDMSGVTYSTASGHIACTDTAVLVFAHQRGDAAKGIQRSTNGNTWENVPGITGAGTGLVIYCSEFYAGRLWLAMGGAVYSTDDDGSTWREDIAAAANIRRLGFDSASAKVIAWGPDEVWHIVGAAATKVSDNGSNFTGSFYAEDHRCIYSEGTILNDFGVALLDSDDFQIDPWVDQYSNTFDQICAVIPHGEDRIWQLTAKSSSQAYAGVIEQAYGIYVPPSGGAEVRIEAIGSGGTVNVGTPINGLPTCVSHLALAAGGSHSETDPKAATSANRGQFPVCIAGASNGGTFAWRGGAGLAHQGKTYGDGETVIGNSTSFLPSNIAGFTGLAATHRGGFPGAIATWQGWLTDPVPMLPAQGCPDSADYDKSGAGAVVIKEY